MHSTHGFSDFLHGFTDDSTSDEDGDEEAQDERHDQMLVDGDTATL